MILLIFPSLRHMGFIFRVGVIFAKKTKARKTQKLSPRENFRVYWMLTAHEDGEKLIPCGVLNSTGTTAQCFNYSVLMTPQIPTPRRGKKPRMRKWEGPWGRGGRALYWSLETLHGYHWLRKGGTQKVLDGACPIYECVYFYIMISIFEKLQFNWLVWITEWSWVGLI